MRIARPALRKARIEIVPMIDTIFFLLVFFMMSTLSMVKLNGLNMSVPKDAISGADPAPKRVSVAISPNGDLFVDESKTEIGMLPNAFRQALGQHKDATVVLSVAASQKTQTLVSTMDVLDEIMTEVGDVRPILIATPKTGPNVEAASDSEDH